MNYDIKFEEVSRKFGDYEAITSLSFQAKSGCITGFIGKNGAGKTTALRILLGLIKADSGIATIGGKKINELPIGALGFLIGTGAHPARSGRNHLKITAKFLGLDAAEVEKTLEAVELGKASSKLVKKYSMGMTQRLALATALLGNSKVLILDEPTNGLDPDGVYWLREELIKRKNAGTTILLSSHILSELEQVIDEVVVINKKILWSGDKKAALNATAVGTLEGLYKTLSEGKN